MAETTVWNTSPQTAADVGMSVAWHAMHSPDRVAVIDRFGEQTFAMLNENANRLASALNAAGLERHSAVALICSNRAEFLAVHAASYRSGMRLVPVNWHLTGEEIAYITVDSEAQAIIAEGQFSAAAAAALEQCPEVKIALAIGGEIDGFEAYEAVLESGSAANPQAPELGSPMLYTSGTTGRPKGVYRWPPRPSPMLAMLVGKMIAFQPETDRALVTGPLYHAAPLSLNAVAPLNAGVGLVLMDRFDAEQALALIGKHNVAYTHMVATMFNRLLKLPDAVRARYNLSSLRAVLHGAAPCPHHVKAAVIDWLGPLVFEYYAATEGGATLSDSATWLARPGTVGQAIEGTGVRVLDDDGNDCPPGVMGKVYLLAPDTGRFTYFKAPDKTASAYVDNFFTLGDQGHLDEQGYLFLTGRSAETIISGGVNIYPSEIDDVLLRFPGVHDACTVGVPSEEWGEQVRAVITLEPEMLVAADFTDHLLAFCREHLAGFKCPRSVDIVPALPRLPSGKIQRHKVRAPYWEGRSEAI